MNKKLFWFLGFLVVAAISCWATASSFHLMMPSFPILGVYGMTIVFFVLASLAVKWIVDSLNNDGYLTHPKVMLWGGILVLAFTWIIVSLPTNAHTFFYKLKIGDIVTDDLRTTKIYSEQIANRVVVDSLYYTNIEKPVLTEWKGFVDEVKIGIHDGRTGVGEIAIRHITEINKILGADYAIDIPVNTRQAKDTQLTFIVNSMSNELASNLKRLRTDKYQVSVNIANEARKDVANIMAMEDSVHQIILTNQISEDASEPIITQSAGVLKVAYSNIKLSSEFVIFNNEEDKKLYTASNVETKTTRFLNPYSVTYDYFTGKIPFSFTFWIFLSILIDLSGFLFFYKATK